MKKLALLFAGLSLMATTACKDDAVEVQEFPLVGTWKPMKENRTEVDINGAAFTDEVTYSTCQQASRWVFNENSTGKRTNNEEVGIPVTCSVVSARNFSYVYNSSDKNVEIKYQGTVVSDKGKVTLLDAETLNLKIDDTSNPNIYKSTTYTFKRIPQ